MLSKINYFLEIEGLCLVIIIIIILFYYLRKNINPLVFLLTLITWLFNAYIIVILPYDIYLSNYDKQNLLVNELKNNIRLLYSIIYWTIMVNSWVLIPLLSKYEGSGYFTRREKLLYSIKSNLLFYGMVILIVLSLFALAYYRLKEEYINYFLKNCFNFTYLYGFFFLILLLGYSIPKLPKNIYDRIFYQKEVRRIENETKNLKHKLDKVNKDLLDGYYSLVNIKEQIEINREMKAKNLNVLEDKIKDRKTEEEKIKKYETFITKKINYIKKNENIFGIKTKKFPNKSEDIQLKNIFDEIASLNINLKENEWDNLRLQHQLQSSYNEWLFLKTIIIKGKNYKSSIIDQALRESKIKLMENEDFIPIKNISKFKILFYMKIYPIILFIFSSIFLLLGIIILLSEICISLPWKISIFNLLNYWTENMFIIHIFIICSVFVFFLMCLYALMNFKLTKNYKIYGPRQTDAVSILYFTSNFNRIIFPLCLNILFMINHGNDTTKKTCLEKDFGININNHIFLIISKYSPLVLIVFVILNTFGVFSKIIDCFSVENFSSLFFDKNKNSEVNEGYEYLIEINKKNKGRLLKDSITGQLIDS
jgi:hypothetical protein